MKVLAIALALAGIAATAPLNAQVVVRNPANNRVATVGGSWQVVGRDGNGNTIYERSTRDGNGNIVIQRAQRNGNGNMVIISTRTVRNGDNSSGNSANCDYNRTTNSIGDIIFGRTNNTVCEDVNNRDDGVWYQEGRGPNNNSIYVRRTVDANGNLVIQRARRNANGTLTIFNTRTASNSDKQWKKEQKAQNKAWKKGQKQNEHGQNGKHQGGEHED